MFFLEALYLNFGSRMKLGEGHHKFWSEFGNGFKKLTTPSPNFSGSTPPFLFHE